MVWIFACKAQNPLNPSRHRHPPLLAAIESYEKLEEATKEPLDCFLSLESPHLELPPSLKIGASRPLLRALLQSPSLPRTPLGEFVVPRRPHRARSHQERLTIAPGLPHWSKGHSSAARCVAPPPSPTGAVVSHPRLDQ
jgi:hypothetical protein